MGVFGGNLVLFYFDVVLDDWCGVFCDLVKFEFVVVGGVGVD